MGVIWLTGKTHRAGGVLCSVIGFELLRRNGLLLPDVNEVIQMMVMYPFCIWGSVASDLDHNWDSSPQKDIVSRGINVSLHITTPVCEGLETTHQDDTLLYKVLNLFNAKHRSWQTHSDLTLIFMLCILRWILHLEPGGIFSAVDISIMALIVMGIGIGVIAHFILDMLTPDGIWFTPAVVFNFLVRKITKKRVYYLQKIHLVPKSKFFATGGKWEDLIRWILNISAGLSVIYIILFSAFPELGEKLLVWFPFSIEFV